MNVDNNENFLDDDGQTNHDQQLNEDMNQELQEDSQNTNIDYVNELEEKVEEYKKALAQSDKTIKEQKDIVLRSRAEVDNIRKRSEGEITKAKKFALERLLSEILPVIDNLERALESAKADKSDDNTAITEGVELTLKTLHDTVSKFGLETINPIGEDFNPELHQAMSIQESPDFDSNKCMLVMQKGYILNGRVIRPAMVMVSK